MTRFRPARRLTTSWVHAVAAHQGAWTTLVNVAAFLSKAAAVHGERIAIAYGGTTITYSQLDKSTDSSAAGLLDRGLKPGDRLVICMRNHPDLVHGLFAAFKAGVIVVPVNFRLHPLEVAYIAKDCGARGLLYDEGSQGVAAKLRDLMEPKLLFERRLPAGHTDRALPNSDPTDPAWLFYTSGTTGTPKGATLTHRNLVAMTMNCLADVCSFQPEDVVLHCAPLTHGSGLYLIPSLARGATNLISHQSSFDPDGVLRTIGDSKVSVIAFLAPTMIVRLINASSVRAANLSSLRCVIYGGAPMYVDHIKRALDLMGPVWVQIYGQGETPMTGTYLRREDHRYDKPEYERRLGSVGIPRTDIELRIEDRHGKSLQANAIGELALRGQTVMKGYWGNPSATAETLRDGWLHTGDLGFIDADGYVFIVDRAKDMIISAGNNIYARETEEALLSHPAVLEAAVIGLPDPLWGESVHAVVVLRPGSEATHDELVDHCKNRIASYKKPRTIEFVDDLPKSAYGKVLKRELRARAVGKDVIRSVPEGPAS